MQCTCGCCNDCRGISTATMRGPLGGMWQMGRVFAHRWQPMLRCADHHGYDDGSRGMSKATWRGPMYEMRQLGRMLAHP